MSAMASPASSAMSAIWHDSGTWIALGVTLVTLVAAVAMHRIFVKILKEPAPEEREQLQKDE